MKRTLLAGAVLGAFLHGARGAVEGRYVRVEALTHTMENSEFEVFSGGENRLRGHPERLSSGDGWGGYGAYDRSSSLHYRRLLTDGNTSPDQRGSVRAPDPKTSFAHMEADLGKRRPIDTVTFYVSRWDNPQIKVWFGDPDGWRVVTVLDENRKVVCSYRVTLYTPEFKKQKGVMSVQPEPGAGPFAGRFIDPASRGATRPRRWRLSRSASSHASTSVGRSWPLRNSGWRRAGRRRRWTPSSACS
jgi:hypothetical protein